MGETIRRASTRRVGAVRSMCMAIHGSDLKGAREGGLARSNAGSDDFSTSFSLLCMQMQE